MKKLAIFLILLVLIAVAILLLKKRTHLPANSPTIVQGNPYRGGSGQGYASGEYRGRIDGSR